MTALEQTAVSLARLQEHLEQAAERCAAAADHADAAHQAAVRIGAPNTVQDADEIRAAVSTLRVHLDRTMAVADVAAGTVRAAMRTNPTPGRNPRPTVPAPVVQHPQPYGP